MTEDAQTTLVDGTPVTDDHREIDPGTGMQKDYVVLSKEERAKGFVRPVRRTYKHAGPPAPANLRDLMDEERQRYTKYDYVKYEEYPDSESSAVGRYWTQDQLDRLVAGCGTVTTMALALAETYARDPGFYSGTFCANCKAHFPVGEKGEFVWEGTDERVGT